MNHCLLPLGNQKLNLKQHRLELDFSHRKALLLPFKHHFVSLAHIFHSSFSHSQHKLRKGLLRFQSDLGGLALSISLSEMHLFSLYPSCQAINHVYGYPLMDEEGK